MKESGEQLLVGKEAFCFMSFALMRSNREGCEPVIPGGDHKVAVDDN